MPLSLGFLGELDFSGWLYGLVAAFVSGGASAVTSGVVVSALDPKDYNLTSGKIYGLMAAVFVVNGLMGMALYLTHKPVPDHVTVKTTVQETVIDRHEPQTKTVTTREETHVEAKDKV